MNSCKQRSYLSTSFTISRGAVFVLLAVLTPLITQAQNSEELLVRLQTGWASANYELVGDDQIQAFEALIKEGDDYLEFQPNDPEIQTWTGIIKSSLAGAKGGLGALSLAKEAKVNLENAIKLDGSSLGGSAYTSLGVLYHSVPGWPIGFGNDKLAKELLLKGLEVNPDGIDSNYFYADYLANKKDYEGAITHYHVALKAQPRHGRELADAGRRNEINLALERLRSY